MKDKENIDMYKKGVSKESLVKLVFYNEKKEKNITKHEAMQKVETLILQEYLKNSKRSQAVMG